MDPLFDLFSVQTLEETWENSFQPYSIYYLRIPLIPGEYQHYCKKLPGQPEILLLPLIHFKEEVLELIKREKFVHIPHGELPQFAPLEELWHAWLSKIPRTYLL